MSINILNAPIVPFLIQSTPYSFPEGTGYNFGYPMAPLITAKTMASNESFPMNTVIVRALVFVDSAIEAVNDVRFIPDTKNTTDSIFYGTIQYSSPDHEPTSYRVWCFDVVLEDKGYDTIALALENDDPKTSRGTTTTVQR